MDPILGGILSTASSLGSASIQNQWNASAVDKQQDFQEMMSNTAYTRATADMKNAGLNPAMMYGSGGPASVPSGASIAAPSIGNPISQGMDTAVGLQKNQREQDLVDSQTDNIDMDTDVKDATVDKINQDKKTSASQYGKNIADQSVSYNQSSLLDKQIEREGMANQVFSATRPDKIKSSHAEGDWANVNQWLNAIKSVSGSAGALKSIGN